MLKGQVDMNRTDRIETFEELGWIDPELDPKLGP